MAIRSSKSHPVRACGGRVIARRVARQITSGTPIALPTAMRLPNPCNFSGPQGCMFARKSPLPRESGELWALSASAVRLAAGSLDSRITSFDQDCGECALYFIRAQQIEYRVLLALMRRQWTANPGKCDPGPNWTPHPGCQGQHGDGSERETRITWCPRQAACRCAGVVFRRPTPFAACRGLHID